MTVTSASNIIFDYPSTPRELSLESWGRFLDAYAEGLTETFATIDEAAEEDKEDAQEFFAVEQAYALAAHFSGTDFGVAATAFTVEEVLTWYQEYFTTAMPDVFPIPGTAADGLISRLSLPDAVLQPLSPVNFGQFIDSKVLLENKDLPRWQMILLLACIYLHSENEAYNEKDAIPGSMRYNMLLENLPAAAMATIAKWFEDFNENLQTTFTLFHPGKVKGGRWMKEHMKQWGWINFLKEIAKTKVFDIPASGMNSIDCARAASAFDVLTYASEDKDFAEARAMDQEEAYKK